MTEPFLSPLGLNKFEKSRDVAIENLTFYACLFDSLEEGLERDSIGQAMAQKQAFIGAVEAILTNHEVSFSEAPPAKAANDCSKVLGDIDLGDHLAQETKFHAAVKGCRAEVDDELTLELLNHHMKAADLAVSAIKATSLKI